MSNKITIFRFLKSTNELQMLSFDNFKDLQEFSEKFNDRIDKYTMLKNTSIETTKKELEDVFTEWVWTPNVKTDYTIDGKKYGDDTNE